MSVLGSVFLGILAAAPSAVESVTHLTALRGFAGTSVLILVGVAQDTARKVRLLVALPFNAAMPCYCLRAITCIPIPARAHLI